MMKEHELQDLGIFRIPIPIPFRQAGGPVNAYVIEANQGLMIFDPGLGTEPSLAALAKGFARIGHRFEEVNRIILSHGHIDHFGAAAWVVEQAGHAIPISIHSADSDKVLQTGEYWPTMLRRNAALFTQLGMSMEVLEEAAARIDGNASLGRRLAAVDPLIPGERIPCKHITLEVYSMPGHTTGLCCLYEPDYRLLFSADHLLKRVSPNPVIDLRLDGERSSFKPLVSYFQSLNRVRALAIDLVLPGHAEPFDNCLKVVDSLSVFYQRRQAKILEILERGSLTVYEVMKELFLSGDGFELILMMSETLGNLEVLEERGEVEREMKEGVIRFRNTGIAASEREIPSRN
jgi:glyoxylase-like metal-dependent hydrolase (beta-lactamase superfamily II)